MTEQLIGSFVHLKKKEKSKEALIMLKRIASHVKPIMKSHQWHVKTLAEFFPTQTNLLGTNYGRGIKISLRLRPHYNDSEFLPFDDVMGTMLHELTHNVHGPHDAKFYALLDDLNIEYDKLLSKGFKGDDGDLLGGGRVRSITDVKKEAARRAASRARGTGSDGVKLGGDGSIPGSAQDVKARVAQAAIRRAHDAKWCGHGRVEDPILVDEEEENINLELDAEPVKSSSMSQVIRTNEHAIEKGSETLKKKKKQKTMTIIEIESDDNDDNLMAETILLAKPSKVAVDSARNNKRSMSKTLDESEDLVRMKSRGLIADSLYDHLKKIKKTEVSQSTKGRSVPLGKWQCNVCTLLNPLRVEQCTVCETERPYGAHHNGDYWVCEQCLQFNEKDRWMCQRCQGIKKTS